MNRLALALLLVVADVHREETGGRLRGSRAIITQQITAHADDLPYILAELEILAGELAHLGRHGHPEWLAQRHCLLAVTREREGDPDREHDRRHPIPAGHFGHCLSSRPSPRRSAHATDARIESAARKRSQPSE